MWLAQDRELLQRFRGGDQSAMEQVFRHYVDDLARWLDRGLTGRLDSRDVLQETFRAAFEERARLAYSGLHPYRAYLRRIARNLVVDRWRKSGHEVLPETDIDLDQQESVDDMAPSPAEQIEQAELARLLALFRQSLTSEERRFVELRYEQDLPQRHVADRLKSTRRHVRTMETRIRRLLLAFLDKTDYLAPRAPER